MRKNTVNNNVIRAMAIGISAVLAASSPMTVFAEEPENEEAKKADETKNPESAAFEQVKDTADLASERTNEAKDSTDLIKQDVEENVSAGEVKDGDGNDLSQDLIDAAGLLENAEDEGGSSLKDAEASIDNADALLSTAEANEELADGAYAKAEEAAADASAIASKVKDEMKDANEAADEKVEDLENAENLQDARTAYDELETIANVAEAEFDSKLEAYNEAKAAYEAAAIKVKEYEEAYNKALSNADSNAAEAQEELEKAKANAQALEDAAAAAKEALDVSAADALEIAKMENLTRTDKGLDWRNEDKLFIAIMEKYYLPEKCGINGAKVTRVAGYDENGRKNDEYNYFKAEYTDEVGNRQEKYYNFKMDQKAPNDDIVIFEKREVEVKGNPNETPDEYVGKNGSVAVSDVNEGLENGSIVRTEDGKIVEKNEMTDSETLISDSVITGSSKEDVIVDESTAKETWLYDEETGKLVKNVTADVTTVTYTDATYILYKPYATDAERDAAAAVKKAEIEAETGKDATIKEFEKTSYTYTASGTYIPTFTKTVEVNKEYESGYLWNEADSEKEAKEKAFDWAKDKIDDDLGDYYLIGDIRNDLSVSMTEEETEEYKIFGKTHTIVTDDSDYLVTGTVSATYAKVEKKTITQNTFGSLWNDIKALFGQGIPTNEQLEAAARNAVEAEGGIFVSASWNDFNFNKATIRYVPGVKVTTEEKNNEQDAKNSVNSAALAQAQANDKDVTGVWNVNTTGTEKIEHTAYCYQIDHLRKKQETTENKTVETQTYGNADALSGKIIQNKNYKDGNLLMTQTDDDYRAFVDNAKASSEKYERLLKEAEQANAKVDLAKEKVDELKEEIEALKNKNSNAKALSVLERELSEAQADKDEAEKNLSEILDKLANARITLQDIEKKYTVNPGGGNNPDGVNNPGGGNNPGGNNIVDTGNVISDTTVVPTVSGGAATALTINTVRTAPTVIPVNAVAEDQEVTEIEDEETPLAAAEKDTDKEQKEIVAIEDEETPLAASTESVKAEKMSWWWLLLIALLGATGYEMYRKHQQKKKASAEENLK